MTISEFIQLSPAIATFIVGLMVAYVAWRQWRTTHERVRIDLFERRMQIYDDLAEALIPVVQSGQARDEDMRNFYRAGRRIKVLFNKETEKYHEDLYRALVDLQFYNQEIKSAEDDKTRVAAIKNRRKCFDKVTGFYREFFPLIEPYVRFDRVM